MLKKHNWAKLPVFAFFAKISRLTPLPYKQNAVNAIIPTKNSVNAALSPVKRR